MQLFYLFYIAVKEGENCDLRSDAYFLVNIFLRRIFTGKVRQNL